MVLPEGAFEPTSTDEPEHPVSAISAIIQVCPRKHLIIYHQIPRSSDIESESQVQGSNLSA